MKSDVPALQRACDILLKISEAGTLSSSELYSSFDIPRASMVRLLNCLESNGFIVQNPSLNGFQVGDRIKSAVISAYENEPLVVASREMLRRLAEKWHVTFVVYEYIDPFQVVWRTKSEPAGGIKTQAPGRTINRMNMNAQGQLFLSFFPDEKVRELFKRGLAHKATEFTLMDEESLLSRIDTIRKQGYAYQERENSPYMKQLAVPLSFNNIPGVFALGCFMKADFPDVEAMKDDMLMESAMLKRYE